MFSPGFPQHMPYSEFRRRFECLLPEYEDPSENYAAQEGPRKSSAKVPIPHFAPNTESRNDDDAGAQERLGLLDHRAGTEQLLNSLHIDPSQYKLGVSRVLMRTELVGRLEDERDLSLSTVITSLQAHCRGWLAKRRLEKQKVRTSYLARVFADVQHPLR